MLDVTGRVVAPGFIDPHGHSDGSLFLDGALVSHLRQGFTTQLSGNCGDTLAPITAARPRARRAVAAAERADRALAARSASTSTRSSASRSASNVAFLVGHGTVRGSVLGPDARAPDDRRARGDGPRGRGGDGGRRVRALDRADLRARDARRTRRGGRPWSRPRRAHGGLYATHMRNEAAGLFEALDEARRDRPRRPATGAAAPGLAPQVRRRAAVWGRAGEAVARPRARPRGGPRRRRGPVPVHGRRDDARHDPAAGPAGARASTRASPRSATWRSASGSAPRSTAGSRAGRTSRPTRAGTAIRISYAGEPPGLVRPVARRARRGPRRRTRRTSRSMRSMDDRLDVSVVIDCMTEPDVEAIMAVPWIAVCTDAEGRRPGPPDPRRRPAAPADLRQHGPGPRHVRPRARRRCRSRRRSPS